MLSFDNFMKHARLLISFLALTLASGILLVSLFSVSLVQSSGTPTEATQRQLYFSNEVLPDNIAYPFLMVADRVRLESSSAQERVFMQVEYGFRRLDAAKKLLEKDKDDLAVSTFTKSAKYFQQAGLEAQQFDAPQSVRNHVIKALEYFDKDARALLPQIPEQDRSTIEKLLQENQAVISTLK
jgi:hypothetical protein